MLAILAVALLCLPAFAGEFAVLSSGARLRADRHEVNGDTTRLFHKTGVTELPSTAVAYFEHDVVSFEQVDASLPPPRLVPDPKLVRAASTDPKVLIREAAVRSGLPPAFVESVARVESAFRPDAVSAKGAIGVMQLMPDTARALGADPHDMGQNIEAGARLLRELLLKYDGDVVKALAAYNAGSAAVDRFGGVPPFDETQRYVNRVIGFYQPQPQK